MVTITDDMMRESLGRAKTYSLVILHGTATLQRPESRPVIWEHARRNFQMRAEGILQIVCPVADGTDVSGIGIFNASPDEVKVLMDADPGVQAGLFTYEVHPCRSFPGDSLR